MSGKYRYVYKETDNELLGLEKFSEEDLVELSRLISPSIIETLYRGFC